MDSEWQTTLARWRDIILQKAGDTTNAVQLIGRAVHSYFKSLPSHVRTALEKRARALFDGAPVVPKDHELIWGIMQYTNKYA
jgi:hypothetical protein